MFRVMEAAFFDLDKTIISTSSSLALSRPMYRAGMVPGGPPPDLHRELLARGGRAAARAALRRLGRDRHPSPDRARTLHGRARVLLRGRGEGPGDPRPRRARRSRPRGLVRVPGL